MKRLSERGTSLIDSLVAIAVLTTVFVGILGFYQLSLRLLADAKARVSAVALATESLEQLRSLSYDDIGTVGGIPAGLLPQNETLIRNGVSFDRRLFVQYVDDDRDGTGASDENGILTDYKRAKVEITWESHGSPRVYSSTSTFAPPGIETTAGGGTLQVTVIDAGALPVANAEVRVVNSSISPAVDVTTFTNNSGMVFFPGGVAGGGYEISATKSGYSTAQTYDTDATNVSPNPPHMTVIESQVNPITLAIDALSSLSVTSYTQSSDSTFTDSFDDDTKVSEYSGTERLSGAVYLAGSTSTGSDPNGAFVESSGQVVFEAEHFHAQATGQNGGNNKNFTDNTWVEEADASASGGAGLLASPNQGDNAGDSTLGSSVSYEVDFTTPGTYYVWVRSRGVNGSDDSFHAGLNGVPATYGKFGMDTVSGSWSWDDDVNNRSGDDRVTINVPSAGTHTFTIWMREDGVRVDKVLLTTNSSYTPTGSGPSESGRATTTVTTYGTSGSLRSAGYTPATLNSWQEATWSGSVPTDTSILVQVEYLDTATTTWQLVSDTDLPNNSSGFSATTIDISSLDTGVYGKLRLRGLLSSTDSGVSPSISSWTISAGDSEVIFPNAGFTLSGSKYIGATSGGSKILKYTDDFTTDGSGEANITSLEWDTYNLTSSDPSYQIARVCPSGTPLVLAPGVNVPVTVLYVPASTNALRVTVQDSVGAPLSGADVALSRSGFSATLTTDDCGQVLFRELASATDYTVNVSLSGYSGNPLSSVEVAGESSASIIMSSI